ncbi:hypothetical protein ACLMJK_006944 [Lecanora helva]
MTAPPSYAESFKSAWAQDVSAKRIGEEFQFFEKKLEEVGPDALHVPKLTEYALNHETNGLLNEKEKATKLPPGSKVCIIGAGMAGLYIAMILDYLNIEGLSYEILEGSDRVGGRVYTHYFSDPKKPENKHDYYDVGAMRFPRIKIMEKTFALLEYLGSKDVPLIDYVLKSDKEPSRYNDETIIGKGDESNKDQFKVSKDHGGRISPELVEEPDKYVTQTFEPFKDRLRQNWKEGFKHLMEYDEFSVRGFMMSHGNKPLNEYYSIQWLETLTDGSGLYDQGFAEGVIDSLDFDYWTEYVDKKNKVHWQCIEGGTQLVPEAMNKRLQKPLTKDDLGKRVTKIAENRSKDRIEIKVAGEKEQRKYMTVFATPTLACLQRIDLTELGLLYEQKDALRSLHYDTASKVGMKFKKAWWIELGIIGGLGKTDMPLRTCVYPSYNLNDKGEAVLLCSYSWAQDAARMGSLMKGDWKKETELKETLINNLTWLHLKSAQQQKSDTTFDDLYNLIDSLYIEHHAFDWHNHEFSSGNNELPLPLPSLSFPLINPTTGAYGKFAPGQFSNLYTALTNPIADSRFHIVGEAASAHHGWIVGALVSAHQAVLNFLRRFKLFDAIEKLKGCPFLGPVPDEMDVETSEKKVVLGLLDPRRREEARMEVEREKVGAGKGVAEGEEVNGANK